MLKLSQNSRQGMGGRPPGVQRRESDVRLPRHELRFVLQIIFRKIVTSDLVMRNTLCQLINPKNTFLKLTHLENDHPYKDFFRQQQREMPRRHGSRPGSFTARRSVLFRNVVWIKSQGGTLVARIDPAETRTSDWVARTWLTCTMHLGDSPPRYYANLRPARPRGSSTKIPDFFDFFQNKCGLFFWCFFSAF